VGIGSQLASQPKPENVGLFPGQVTAIDWATGTATVNIAGGVVNAQMIDDAPAVNRPVWVLQVGTTAVCLGKPSGPVYGTVQSDGVNGFAAVLGDDGVTYSLPYSTMYQPASGHRVALEWAGYGRIEQRVSGEYSPAGEPIQNNPTPPPGAGAATGGDRVFYPVDSASWQGGGWARSDSVVYGSSYAVGAFFYGSQIADSIPPGATITGIEIYLTVDQASGSQAQFGYHPYGTRPGAAFTPTGMYVPRPLARGFAGYVPLDLKFGTFLRDTPGGIGTKGAGYRVFRGKSGGQSQGALHITWK
jgi:hypothetical protein